MSSPLGTTAKTRKESYKHAGSRNSFLYSTVGEYLRVIASEAPEKEAIVSQHQGIRKTYQEFCSEVETLVRSLGKLGLKKGDRVAVWGRNSYEWILMSFALARAGIILVCVCPAFKASEMDYALRKVQCKAIFIQHDLEDNDYYGILCSLDASIASSEADRELSLKSLPHLKRIIYAGKEFKSGTIPFQSLMKTVPANNNNNYNNNNNIVNEVVQPDDVFCIHYTSGTTGKPKAVKITNFAILNNSVFTFERCILEEPLIMCMQLPLYHIFAWIQFLGAISLQAKIIIPSARFSPLATLKTVEFHRCNYIVGVETMFLCMLEKMKEIALDMSSLKLLKLGGSPSKLDTVAYIEKKFNAKVLMGYGSTETSGTVATEDYVSDDKAISKITCGKLQPHTEVKIVNSEGQVVPLGEKGELLVRGFQIFQGYWDDEGKTKEAIDINGWYHTGDIGHLDQEGNLYIDGRLKNMVIRGGENIYPNEIEDLLRKHPVVRNVQVVGVPDRKMGEELCALLILKPDTSLTTEQIKEFCKGKIAHFKIPKYSLVVDSFPTTSTGKYQLCDMKSMAERLLGLTINDQPS